jgi:peptidoglycan/LPS O-acetylase OafA/YrhL
MTTSLPYAAFRATSRFSALDGLRAFACLAVVIGHARGVPYAFLHGYRGVLLFFVLSGFLITTLALREEAKTGAVDLHAFFVRRVFRIMPLYYLALAAIMIAVFAFNMESYADAFRHHLAAYLLYMPEFPIFQSDFKIPFAQAWSLGIEEKFYLVWPIVAFGLLARSRRRIGLVLVLIASTGILNARSPDLAQMWGAYMDILIGCLVALALHERRLYEKLSVLGRTPIAWGVFGVLAIAMLSPLTGTQFGERYFAMLAAMALIALVTTERGPARMFAHPALAAVGAWSYGIYLLHIMVYDMVNKTLPAGSSWDYLTMPLCLLIVLPLARFLHLHYEQPIIAFGRRVAAAPIPAPAWHAKVPRASTATATH